MATVVEAGFEWDSAKAAANRAKHGVSFEEAIGALSDPRAVWLEDAHHPDRVVTLGLSMRRPNVLYVVSTERGTRTRIISARKATPHEARIYEAK